MEAKHKTLVIVIVSFTLGIIAGMLWSKAQENNRRDLREKYGIYYE